MCARRLVVFFPVHCVRARRHGLAAVSQHHPWPHPFVPAPRLAICCGLQRLGFHSNGFLSLASRFDTGGALSYGQCNTPTRLCVPMLEGLTSSHPSLCWCSQTVPSRSRGSGDTGARIPPSSRAQAGFLTSLVRPAPIFGPQCSPSTSKQTVQRLHRCHRYRLCAHPLALSSSHRHGIAPPRPCDLSRRCSPSCYCHHHRCHHHCDYYHYQDTTQQWT